MKSVVIFILVALLNFGCNGQQQESDKGGSEEQAKNQPKESWKVNKQMDEMGNIIGYDSTYTWSYTNVQGDSLIVDVDSVMNSFYNYFDNNFPTRWNRSFTQPLWSDSLFYRDFKNDNYFHNRWRQEYFEFDTMFRRMDSLRNQFFFEHYPGFLKPPDKKN